MPNMQGNAPRSGGCAKAIVVVAIILFVMFVGIGLLIAVAAHRVTNKASEAFGMKPCPFLSDSAAREVFGGDVKAQQFGRFFNAMTGVVQDTRAIANAPSCIITGDNSNGFARVAKLTTSDAQARFQSERKAANPVTVNKGNGLSVTSEGWFGNDVHGLGDEAFCTSMALYGAVGVLARQGDTLVYASVLDSNFDPSHISVDTSNGAITDDATCAKAQQLARLVLG
jgi:hypothetical protein